MHADHRWAYLILMTVGVVLEVAGDVFFKKWNDESRWSWLAVGATLYACGSLAWARSLKYEDLGKAVTVFMVANVILAIIAGMALFGEKLNAWNWAGVALGVAAIFLMEA